MHSIPGLSVFEPENAGRDRDLAKPLADSGISVEAGSGEKGREAVNQRVLGIDVV